MLLCLSWFPRCPWHGAGSCLLQESKQRANALVFGEVLWGISWAAARSEVYLARCVEEWAVPEDMLYGLNCLPALAGDLFWHVLREETAGVLAREGVSCGKAV